MDDCGKQASSHSLAHVLFQFWQLSVWPPALTALLLYGPTVLVGQQPLWCSSGMWLVSSILIWKSWSLNYWGICHKLMSGMARLTAVTEFLHNKKKVTYVCLTWEALKLTSSDPFRGWGVVVEVSLAGWHQSHLWVPRGRGQGRSCHMTIIEAGIHVIWCCDPRAL